MLSKKLAPAARLGGEPHTFAIVGRVLGDAAVKYGDFRAARTYYEQALAVAEAMHHRPEIALLHVGLADVLPRAEAEEHLDNAISLLESMHMRPALERAVALRSQFTTDSLTAREREVASVVANLERMAPNSGRNDALKRAAWTLGRWVASGALDQADVEDELYAAAECNHVVADDGARQCWATIRSGLGADLQQPIDLTAL
jgi:hypothetical protein